MRRPPRRQPSSPRARVRVRLACAALAAACAGLLAACGPGGPKPKNPDDGNGGNGDGGPSRGITLLAGNATRSGSLDDKGSKASFNTPRGIVIDSGGNLFVADELNRVIRKITPDGTVSTFAGTVGNTQGSADGNGSRARFTDPTALAIDASDNLYVLDNYQIRKITPSAVVTTLATLPSSPLGDNLMLHPAGIAIDASGNLFVTTGVDTRRLSGNQYRNTTTLEGPVNNSLDSVLTPRGIAVDADGVAYVADLNGTISRALSGASSLSRFAGIPGGGSTDGNSSQAGFRQVVALTVAKDGTLYAADAQSNTIRQITSSAVTKTVAGTVGKATLVTGGAPGSLANVAGITVDTNGVLYVTSGNAVVKIVP